MAKPVKLPSGNWNIRVYDRNLKKQVSLTAESKEEAELLAAQYKTGIKKKSSNRTVGDCIDDYISQKENILSPTTIDGYRRMKNNTLAELCPLRLDDLTPEKIQRHVNRLALTHSPKTVRNVHGLLVSVLNVYAPNLIVRTTLPAKRKILRDLPDVKALLDALHGDAVELPCLLALWEGLRMSEIRGARKSDVTDGILTIRNTIVTVNGRDVEKPATKTYESTRRLRLPSYILALIDALPPEQTHLTELSGQAIYKRFSRLLENNGLPHIPFHTLRHLNASVMLSLGVPDKYAMERGGWSSPSVMKSVYQHTFSAERAAVDDKIDAYFTSLLSDETDA